MQTVTYTHQQGVLRLFSDLVHLAVQSQLPGWMVRMHALLSALPAQAAVQLPATKLLFTSFHLRMILKGWRFPC